MSKNLLLLSTILLIASKNSLTQRKRRLFHGMGSSCTMEDYTSTNLEAKCIETGSGPIYSIYSIKYQGQVGCQILKDEIKEYKNVFKSGLYLIGLSQGGLIARWIYKHCDTYILKHPIRPFIKRIFTFGTPNLGISNLPENWNVQNEDNFATKFFKNSILKIANKNKNVDYQSKYSPFCYINKIDDGKRFYSVLISDLLTDDYSELEFMMNFVFKKEIMITPIESTSFEAKFLNDGNFMNFQDTSIYKKKNLKLNELYDTGRFYNCQGEEGHLNYTSNEIFYISLFLDDCKDTDNKNPSKTYRQCIVRNLQAIYDNQTGNKNSGNVLKMLRCQGNFNELVKINKEEMRKIKNGEIILKIESSSSSYEYSVGSDEYSGENVQTFEFLKKNNKRDRNAIQNKLFSSKNKKILV